MGRYSNSNFGDISGKVGNAVGSNWRGIKYMRSLSSKRAKGGSPLQLAQYAKFALAASHLSVIKDVLNLGFGDKKLNKISGYNAAVKLFLAEAITGTYPNFAIDYAKVKLSKGSLYPAEVAMNLGTDISLAWPEELNSYSSFADDKMFFIIFNRTKHTFKLNTNLTRADLGISLPLPNAGDELHIWSFCVKRDGRTVSNSTYVGSVTTI